MGTTFKQLYKKLRGAIDVVPVSFAPTAINEALREIYDERDWSFLWKDSYIRTPALISGNGAVTKFSNQLTLNALTKALVDAITADDVPLDERQIKFFGTSMVDKSLYYNIGSYDSGTGVITFANDEIFLDSTNANIRLEILKVYYRAPYVLIDGSPVIDFRRFAYVMSPDYQRLLRLGTTISEINKFDPQRAVNGDPRYFIPYGIDSTGYMLYELYPVPRTEKILQVKYLRNGVPLVEDSDTIPDHIITEQLVLSLAKQKAYEYVIANAQNLGIKSVGHFSNLIALLNNPNSPNSYPVLLQKAKNKDEELFPQAYIGDFSSGYSYFDDLWLGYDPTLPHDRAGETLVIDANA